MLEATIINAVILWFAFFLINHAELFTKVRTAAMPALPGWVSYPLSCALCFAFWTMTAFSLFTGFTPMLLTVPVATLFIDMAYNRLKPTAS